ncbi:pseudaminic acid synthase [Cupriavidus sp. AcVe19-6a]|uniref:pseudaminic acid synthase n=1 Tax=Cupriavidus sp. AcVe19-6a TaxID=2821358 RepID=UPI001AEB1C73|nr:pseudaminic acid synthase [Cupriavidus sp. AcVe19-6a]MBP0640060.1 pseudaminic acid synthase [Cupriavidus sp. AcVe19-6a]
MNRSIAIAGRKIGVEYPPYLIAELSANHNGSLETAFKIVEMAAKAGADAVKLQTYRPDTITIKSDRPEYRIERGPWAGKTLYDLYEWAHMPWEWHKPLFEKARQLEIAMFSSPFDRTAVDLLEDLNAPAYKIASFEAIDLPLIRYAASTRKPLIISTGMANADEIAEAISSAIDAGCNQLAILHCISAYPSPAEDYNLATIRDLANRFDVVVGLSDHTIDNTTAITSIGLGAALIEKHVTLDRTGGGPDDSFSLEPKELEALVVASRTAWRAVGKVSYERATSELENVKFRRSLCAVADIKAGELFTESNVRSIRPGFGLAPKHYDNVLGHVAKCNLAKGQPITVEDVA